MTDWSSIAAVATGGALGAAARFLVAAFISQRLGLTGFPYSTLFINVVGSFLIGVVSSLASGGFFGGNPALRNFLAAGILGGFTTFSTFSLETLELSNGSPGLAVLYATLSVALGVGAALAGYSLSRTLLPH